MEAVVGAAPLCCRPTMGQTDMCVGQICQTCLSCRTALLTAVTSCTMFTCSDSVMRLGCGFVALQPRASGSLVGCSPQPSLQSYLYLTHRCCRLPGGQQTCLLRCLWLFS
jgi:hypothetical protein